MVVTLGAGILTSVVIYAQGPLNIESPLARFLVSAPVPAPRPCLPNRRARISAPRPLSARSYADQRCSATSVGRPQLQAQAQEKPLHLARLIPGPTAHPLDWFVPCALR
jgi:hypothetical protein